MQHGSKYIRQLEDKRLINVEATKVRTKSGEVRNGTLRFTIRPIHLQFSQARFSILLVKK